MRVQLDLRGHKLCNVAGAFKGTSDPFAVVTHVSKEEGEAPVVLGKTEVIKNSLSPEWAKVFIFDYELGTPMHVAVGLFDEVRKGDNISMGTAMFEIGSILGSKGNTKAKKMKKGGTLYAHVQKSEGSGTLKIKLRGKKLKNTEGFMRKSDPFFELHRKSDGVAGASWDNVFRSKTVKDNLDPIWGASVVDLSTLCGGDLDRPVKVVVYDYEKDGDHVLMGEFETSVNGLLAAKDQSGFTMKKKGKGSGTICVLEADVAGVESITDEMAAMTTKADSGASASFVPPPAQPTFVDYISGGCELNLCVAIDFTGSNGDPRKPGTLHYLSRDGSKNEYEKAIHAIGSILDDYDSNKQYPVWGFGAKYGGIVRHCFQCGSKQEVEGVEGIIQAYHEVFKSGLIMSGPTVLTEVLQTAAAQAVSSQEAAAQRGEQAYSILLILTDGSVSDVNATNTALDDVSDSPLSVVIVGVGQDDFSAMRFLDDVKGAGKRDIANFVEFRAHAQSRQSLTSSTLCEIPSQLVGFFMSKGIMPLPPVHRGDDEIVVEAEEEEIDLSLDFGGGDDEIVVAGGGVYGGGGF